MVLKCREVWEVTTNCDTGLKDVTYFGSDPNKENHICGIWVPSSTLDDGSAWTCDVSVLGKVTTILLRLQYKSHCIRRHIKLLSETSLYYKTCHTILSNTRFEYRTQGNFKTRLEMLTRHIFYS